MRFTINKEDRSNSYLLADPVFVGMHEGGVECTFISCNERLTLKQGAGSVTLGLICVAPRRTALGMFACRGYAGSSKRNRGLRGRRSPAQRVDEKA